MTQPFSEERADMVVKMVVPDSPNAGEKGGKERAVGSGSRSIGDDDDDAISLLLSETRFALGLLCSASENYDASGGRRERRRS